MFNGTFIIKAVALFLALAGAGMSHGQALFNVQEPVSARHRTFKIKNNVQVQALKSAWGHRSKTCADAASAPTGMRVMKSRMQAVLARLVKHSNLEWKRLKNFGTCVEIVPDSTGMFAKMVNGPRLHEGTLQFNAGFFERLSTEDELAFVLAHELGHFVLMHEIERTQYSIPDSLERVHEREADELAMRMIANAGYDVVSAIQFVIKLRGESDATHTVGQEIEMMRDEVLSELSQADLAKIRMRVSTPL